MSKKALPADYEACGDCHYDHSYESDLAREWHQQNPCSYCSYPGKKHESNCPMLNGK